MAGLECLIEGFTMNDHQQPVTTQAINSEWEDKLVYDFANGFPSNEPPGMSGLNFQDFDTSLNDFSMCPNSEETEFLNSLLENLSTSSDLSDPCDINGDQISQHSIELNSTFGSIPVGAAPEEPQASANLACVHQILASRSLLLDNATRLKRSSSRQPANVVPTYIDYQPNANGCKPYSDLVKYEVDDFDLLQQLQCDFDDSKKIVICCQPRQKFRPRTQNESRISSHYIRCEEGVKPEYPTILLKPEWCTGTSKNIIEVALVGLDKELHPYALENKQSAQGYSSNSLTFKEQEKSTVYFCLTEEDFRVGYKTFQVEYIKAKQNEEITKDYIRERRLDRSMLRFTRIFGASDDKFFRDEASEVYSTVMTEAYGDIEVEHMGPRMGPMAGGEMVYGVLKGRVLKNDLLIEVTVPSTEWRSQITNFTKNGNVIYFPMPACPRPESGQVIAHLVVHCQGEELYRMAYLYKASLDEELAALSLHDSSMGFPTASASTGFNLANLLSNIGTELVTHTKKATTNKKQKRLNRK